MKMIVKKVLSLYKEGASKEVCLTALISTRLSRGVNRATPSLIAEDCIEFQEAAWAVNQAKMEKNQND